MRSDGSIRSKESVSTAMPTREHLERWHHRITSWRMSFSELLIEEFFYRSIDFTRLLVTEFCQQSTVGLESNQSGEELNFTFSLKNGNVTNNAAMRRIYYAQCRHSHESLQWFNVLMTHLFLLPAFKDSWKYTSLIYETRQFALNRLEQTPKSVTRTMRLVVDLQNEIYWAMTHQKLT